MLEDRLCCIMPGEAEQRRAADDIEPRAPQQPVDRGRVVAPSGPDTWLPGIVALPNRPLRLRAAVEIRPLQVCFAPRLFEFGKMAYSSLASGGSARFTRPFHGTGQGVTPQIFVAYCAMVRSLENLPDPAILRIALRAQTSPSAYWAHRAPSASR